MNQVYLDEKQRVHIDVCYQQNIDAYSESQDSQKCFRLFLNGYPFWEIEFLKTQDREDVVVSKTKRLSEMLLTSSEIRALSCPKTNQEQILPDRKVLFDFFKR